MIAGRSSELPYWLVQFSPLHGCGSPLPRLRTIIEAGCTARSTTLTIEALTLLAGDLDDHLSNCTQR